MKYEVLTAMKVSMLVFWVVTLLDLQADTTFRRNILLLSSGYLPTIPHGVTTQNINIDEVQTCQHLLQVSCPSVCLFVSMTL
jgi:hypothetical protein